MSIFIQINDYKKICCCCQVSKFWKFVGKNESIWRNLCLEIWSDKVYVPQIYRDYHFSGQCHKALKESLIDSKRTFIFSYEFSSTPFYFRFKEASGPYWTEQDPYWKGQEPLRLKFDHEGHIGGYTGVRWYFVNTQGAICRRGGNFICVAINNLTIPTYMICRHRNWGFVIQVISYI